MFKSSIPMASQAVAALCLVSLALLATAAMPSVSHADPAISIAQTHASPLGTVVTVEGSVTVPSGTLVSAGPEDLGFAMQDRTAGIYVSVDTDLHLNVHHQVRVTGVLADLVGLLSRLSSHENWGYGLRAASGRWPLDNASCFALTNRGVIRPSYSGALWYPRALRC